MFKKLFLLLIMQSFVMSIFSQNVARILGESNTARTLGDAIGEIRIGLSPNIGTQLREAFTNAGDGINTGVTKFYENIGESLPKMNTGILKVGKGIGAAGKSALMPVVKLTVGAACVTTALAVIKWAAKKYVDRYLFEPQLIEKRSSSYSLRSAFARFFKKPVNIQDHMVISDALKIDLEYIMKTTKNIQKNGGQFENVLLHGAPGTGKTLFAKLLAEHCGMDYAIVPAANVSQFLTKGTAVQELNNLFEWASRSSNGTIIFFDEAETFLADRKNLGIDAQNALSAFLAKTGTPSNKIMVICATNRPTVMDAAVLSRLGLQVEFPLPDHNARQAQLRMHIKTVFEKQTGAFVKYEYLQNEDHVVDISVQLEGCSGRTLQKFVNRLRQFALAQDTLEINADIINVVIDQIKKDLVK